MTSDEWKSAWEPQLPPPGFSKRVLDAFAAESEPSAAPSAMLEAHSTPARVNEARANEARTNEARTNEARVDEARVKEPQRPRPSRTIWLCAAALCLLAGAGAVARIRSSPATTTTVEGVALREGPSPSANIASSAAPDSLLPPAPSSLAVTAPTSDPTSDPTSSAMGDPTSSALGDPTSSAMGDPSPSLPIEATGPRLSASQSPPRLRGPRCDPNDPLCSDGPAAGAAAGVNESLGVSDIQAVVSAGRGHIKRTCWDALDKPAGAHARVDVTLTIGKSGRIRQSSARGGDDFPHLASCVVAIARSWVFPASDGDTNVNIPFQFIDSR